jgi:molybdate transport system permease protein
MARQPLPGQAILDVLIDLPLSLSPLVLGMAFLVFFTSGPGRLLDEAFTSCGLPLRGAFTGVVLGQTVIAIAFAIRHLRAAFANLPVDEGPAPSVWTIVSRRRSAATVAATITWARTVGEFGPLLLFVGIVPGRSEVLSTAIYLSWISGDLPGAVVAALLMVALSFAVVLLVRRLADRRPA